jgi:hypothetical protein
MKRVNGVIYSVVNRAKLASWLTIPVIQTMKYTRRNSADPFVVVGIRSVGSVASSFTDGRLIDPAPNCTRLDY